MRHSAYLAAALALSASLALVPQAASAQSTVNVSVIVPWVPWNKIVYPEGVYEPYAYGLRGTRAFTFNITFLNYTSSDGSRLE